MRRRCSTQSPQNMIAELDVVYYRRMAAPCLLTSTANPDDLSLTGFSLHLPGCCLLNSGQLLEAI